MVLLVLLANISIYKDNCINEHTMTDSFVDSLIVFNLKFLLDSFCDSPATASLNKLLME